MEALKQLKVAPQEGRSNGPFDIDTSPSQHSTSQGVPLRGNGFFRYPQVLRFWRKGSFGIYQQGVGKGGLVVENLLDRWQRQLLS